MNLTNKRSSLLRVAAAIKQLQEPSDFAKKLHEKVSMTLQKSYSDDSSISNNSDSNDGDLLMLELKQRIKRLSTKQAVKLASRHPSQ